MGYALADGTCAELEGQKKRASPSICLDWPSVGTDETAIGALKNYLN